jgi:uncharacterized membrane protein
MNRILQLLLLVTLISGCVSIDQNMVLSKGTKVQILDVSKDSIFSSDVTNDRESIGKRIIEYTKDELEKRSIEVITENTIGAAKLKYDIRTVSKGFFKFEVKYRVTFETPDGKIIFVDNEEKDDGDIDHIFERMASRTAKFVSKSFK